MLPHLSLRSLPVALVGGVFCFASLQAAPARPESREQWLADGKAAVRELKKIHFDTRQAKNVILFVGDGMSATTVTAARIFEGQLRGESGEENLLSFEKMPFFAHSKTYSVNQQVSDSAPTMTAIITGAKTDDGILSVDQDVVRGDHTTVAGNELPTLLEQAEERGLSTGIVTTAKVTHATPAACYAHVPDRDWEDDLQILASAPEAHDAGFPDIARQLIEFRHGDGIEVVMGGGRSHFFPRFKMDPEHRRVRGSRADGRDLTLEWQKRHPEGKYIWNQAGFAAIDPATTTKLFALFEPGHMQYEFDRAKDPAGEPSLPEMVAKAVAILAKNPKGYFLMVESGRIDHAHHAGNAFRALHETVELAKAVQTARDLTGDDTLIVVTADHGHTLTISGYPSRGNPILGLVRDNDEKGEHDARPAKSLLRQPYTALSYANGPGYTGATDKQAEGPKRFPHNPRVAKQPSYPPRPLDDETVLDPDYLPAATLPSPSETHGGEDVPIYAEGPHAYLFRGALEQNVIYHIMATALGIP